LLTACSNLDLKLNRQETAHYRNYATIQTSSGEEPVELNFRKRDRALQIENEFYTNGNFHATLTAGRHRDQRWMGGMFMRYEF